MRILKVNIENYKCFYGKFSIELNPKINILVGDNEAGKSTILEAINLALTGVLNGKYLKNELTQYLFNKQVVSSYVSGIANQIKGTTLPEIVIEVFFEDDNNHALFEGSGNSERINGCGVVFKIEFDEEYRESYQTLLDNNVEIKTIPIEYYHISWKSFARDAVIAKNIPIKSVLIDSSSNKFQNGSDVYISRIINNDLEEIERVQLSQAYRQMKESFMSNASVQAINQKISEISRISDKNLEISVDLSTQNSWETTLMTYLDDVPFHQIGKGEQCIVKTKLALGHQKSNEAQLILIEEPENHLSHSRMNELIKGISSLCIDKQVVISTHSSFVANKLGLENIILLNRQHSTKLSNLTDETYNFFKKLSGYQTLRLLLCKKAILVEGDSDELIFQKAYLKEHNGSLPIEKGIDVISVGLAFKRFLEIARKIKQPVAILTDNDGNYEDNIVQKYTEYEGESKIKVFADNRNDYPTLEPQMVDANCSNLEDLCKILGLDFSKYNTREKICHYMTNNKTAWALKVFETEIKLEYPKYICDAVVWCNEN